MSSLCLCLTVLIFWLMSSASSFKAVISFLAVCCVSSFSLLLSSAWKGYLIVLVFVGGLLIFVMYLASFTKWSETSYSLLWLVMGGSAFFLESEPSMSNQSMISLYSGGVLEFTMSLILLIFVCLIISQMLFSEKTLRSFL